MKKAIRNSAVILLIAVVGLAILAVYRAEQRKPQIEEAVSPVEAPAEPAEEARALVVKILEPREIPETVALSRLEVDTPVAVEGVETQEVGTAEVEAGVGIRVGAESVLAVVNGVPLTGAQLMPLSRFGTNDQVVLSSDVLAEVLERSINRELIMQEAIVQGIALDEQDLKRLAGTYLHLTGNPLDLGGSGSVEDLNVRGGQDDALFHVRDNAARLLQCQILKQVGEADTAENRMALSEELRNAATIETAQTLPSGDEAKEGQ